MVLEAKKKGVFGSDVLFPTDEKNVSLHFVLLFFFGDDGKKKT